MRRGKAGMREAGRRARVARTAAASLLGLAMAMAGCAVAAGAAAGAGAGYVAGNAAADED